MKAAVSTKSRPESPLVEVPAYFLFTLIQPDNVYYGAAVMSDATEPVTLLPLVEA